jgi:hypothetical protein
MKIFKFPLRVTVEPLFALIFLACFFEWLSTHYPVCYKRLTKWVNQPYVPTLNYCSVENMDSSDLEAFDDTKDFRRSCITVKFNEKIEADDNIFIQQQTDKAFIFPLCTTSLPNRNDKPFLFLENKKPVNELKIGYISVNLKDALTEGSKIPKNCPIDPIILGRKK